MTTLTLMLFSIDLPFFVLEFLESPCIVNSMPSPMATSSWFCSLPGFFSNPSGRSSMPNSSSLSACSADKQRHTPLPIVLCPTNNTTRGTHAECVCDAIAVQTIVNGYGMGWNFEEIRFSLIWWTSMTRHNRINIGTHETHTVLQLYSLS